MTRDERQNRRKHEAGTRLAELARNLCRVMPPLDAGGLCIGAGMTVLASYHGREFAAEYLRRLADELLADPEVAN